MTQQDSTGTQRDSVAGERDGEDPSSVRGGVEPAGHDRAQHMRGTEPRDEQSPGQPRVGQVRGGRQHEQDESQAGATVGAAGEGRRDDVADEYGRLPQSADVSASLAADLDFDPPPQPSELRRER